MLPEKKFLVISMEVEDLLITEIQRSEWGFEFSIFRQFKEDRLLFENILSIP